MTPSNSTRSIETKPETSDNMSANNTVRTGQAPVNDDSPSTLPPVNLEQRGMDVRSPTISANVSATAMSQDYDDDYKESSAVTSEESEESEAEEETGKGELYSSDEVRAELGGYLENVSSDCLFACQEYLENAPNPGLVIEHIHSIGFPLSEADVDAIKKASILPAGSDANMTRRSWMIAGRGLRCDNPAWRKLLVSSLTNLCQKMGIAASRNNVSAQEVALILYKKRSSYEPSCAVSEVPCNPAI